MKPLIAEYRPVYVGATLWIRRRLVALVLLIVVADFLFYGKPAGGAPTTLFLLLLFASAAMFNRLRSSEVWRLVAASFFWPPLPR